VADASIVITAPSSAEKGALIEAYVAVTNTTPYGYSFRGDIYALPDFGADIFIGKVDATIPPGQSVMYVTPFYMPDCNTTIFISLERWGAGAQWQYVTSASKVIALVISLAGWALVAQKTLTITQRPEELGWALMSQKVLAITIRPEELGWALMSQKILAITIRPEAAGWVPMDQKTLSIKVISETVPPSKEEQNLLGPILIGAGAAVLLAAIIPKKSGS